MKMLVLLASFLIIQSSVGVSADLNIPPANMVASFTEISSKDFKIQVTAPKEVINSYATCKAVWFADKAQAKIIGLEPPIIQRASNENWVMISGKVQINPPISESNIKFVSISDTSVECRRLWSWYR